LLLLQQVLVLQDPPLLVESDVMLLDPRVPLLDRRLQLVHLILLRLPVLVLLVEHLVPRDLSAHLRILPLMVADLLEDHLSLPVQNRFRVSLIIQLRLHTKLLLTSATLTP